MNRDRWIKLEFAALLGITLLILWQMTGFVWRTLAVLF
jgi:hypothetical protein